jgi:maltose/moltooligosaccharide transporter
MCVGFFGIQIGFGLQNANTSRIFQTLGAEVDSAWRSCGSPRR